MPPPARTHTTTLQTDNYWELVCAGSTELHRVFGLDQNPNYGILNKEKNVTDTEREGSSLGPKHVFARTHPYTIKTTII